MANINSTPRYNLKLYVHLLIFLLIVLLHILVISLLQGPISASPPPTNEVKVLIIKNTKQPSLANQPSTPITPTTPQIAKPDKKAIKNPKALPSKFEKKYEFTEFVENVAPIAPEDVNANTPSSVNSGENPENISGKINAIEYCSLIPPNNTTPSTNEKPIEQLINFIEVDENLDIPQNLFQIIVRYQVNQKGDFFKLLGINFGEIENKMRPQFQEFVELELQKFKCRENIHEAILEKHFYLAKPTK